MGLLDFFKTAPDKAPLNDKEAVARLYKKGRLMTFWSLVFGYSFFYVTRGTFNITKDLMDQEGLLTADQMGRIEFAFFMAYAFGKLTNGFLADRSHIGRFMGTGLLISAILNIFFGFNHLFSLFVVLWLANGWFQSMGSAPSVSSMAKWFGRRELGRRYGIWSTAHSLGEGLTYIFSGLLVAHLGWRWGFWGAGTACFVVAIAMFFTIYDRPQTYGLPSIAEFTDDKMRESEKAQASIAGAQLEVIRNPAVWILGLSSALMYVGRYGVNGWGIWYFQEEKFYSLMMAAGLLAFCKIAETVGAAVSGFISDIIFRSRHGVAAIFFGVVQVAGMILVFTTPSTYLMSLPSSYKQSLGEGRIGGEITQAFAQRHLTLPQKVSVSNIDEMNERPGWELHGPNALLRWRGFNIIDGGDQLHVFSKYHGRHVLGMAMFGFGLGGLLVFLGGLIAVDICSKRASGAAMGLVGIFSYFGAAIQSRVTGALIGTEETIVHGMPVRDFTNAFTFWIVCAAGAVLLSTTIGLFKPKGNGR